LIAGGALMAWRSRADRRLGQIAELANGLEALRGDASRSSAAMPPSPSRRGIDKLPVRSRTFDVDVVQRDGTTSRSRDQAAVELAAWEAVRVAARGGQGGRGSRRDRGRVRRRDTRRTIRFVPVDTWDLPLTRRRERMAPLRLAGPEARRSVRTTDRAARRHSWIDRVKAPQRGRLGKQSITAVSDRLGARAGRARAA